jgi:hypothetical protein
MRELLAFGCFADDPKSGLANVFFERLQDAARNMRHDLAECLLLADVERLKLCQSSVGNRKDYKCPFLSIGSNNIANLGLLCHTSSLSQERFHFQSCGNQTAPLPENAKT